MRNETIVQKNIDDRAQKPPIKTPIITEERGMLVYGKQRTDYLASQKKKKGDIKWRFFYYYPVLL